MGQKHAVNLLYSAAIVCICGSLWLAFLKRNGPHAAVQVQQQLRHPVAGVALRQGRRFAMEDRTMVVEGQLPGTGVCGAMNYTYAAVYDGHEGSAACDMLQQQLHPLIHAAAAASGDANCSIDTDRFKAAVTAAALKLNDAFLLKARHAQEVLQEQQQASADDESLFSGSSVPEDSGPPHPSTSVQEPTPATSRGSVSSNTAQFPHPAATAAPPAARWDADDGSTAVFAVLMGRQLLVGNVGNSRALLCTSRASNSGSRDAAGVNEFQDNALAGVSSNGSSEQIGALPGVAASGGRFSRHTKTTALAADEAAGSAGAAVPAADSKSDVSTCSSRESAVRQRQQRQPQQQIHGTQVDAAAVRHEVASHAVQPTSSSWSPGGDSTSSSSRSSSSRHSNTRSVGVVHIPSDPLRPIPLSSEHTPERDDESARIRAAGGQIYVNPTTPNGKPRVRGELEVTRSFGDLGFQDQGVVATPEFSTTVLQPGDAFVVLASDGVYEVLSPEDVCQHAWGMWSGSGSVQTALPPPPALAITGQVAAPSTPPQQSESDSSGSASITAAALKGCCDCTAQQQIQQAAEAADVDLEMLLSQRRARRRQGSRVLVQGQEVDQHTTATVIADGATAGAAASAAGSMSDSANQAATSDQDGTPEQQVTPVAVQFAEQQQQQGADITAAVAPVHETTHQAVQCHMRYDDNSGNTECAEYEGNADIDCIDDSSHADMTYGYCKNPTGIESPYTLPQAIALRIVGESYNRMSMDNLAVVVLDVRDIAAAVDEPLLGTCELSASPSWFLSVSGPFWALMSKWSLARSWLGGAVSAFCSRMNRAMAHRAVPASNQHAVVSVVADLASISSVTKPHHVAASTTSTDWEQQDSAKCVHCYVKQSLRLSDSDVEALQLLDVSLPLCDLHNLVEMADGLFVTPRGMLAPKLDPSNVDSEPVAQLHHGRESVAGGAKYLLDNSAYELAPSGTAAEGAAIVCRSSPTASHPAEAAASDPGPREQRQHQQQATALEPHASYVLVQRFASAVSMSADHMHVHPTLGLEELQLEASSVPEQQSGHPEDRTKHDAHQVLLSFARHMRPSRFVHHQLMIAGTSAVPDSIHPPKGPATGEQVCTSLLKAQHQQQQKQQLEISKQSSLKSPMLAASTGVRPLQDHPAGLPSQSGTPQVAQHPGSDAGFMSACLAGTAADPGVQVTQGGQGLSAVVEALAALPLQDSLSDTVATVPDGTEARPGPQLVGDSSSRDSAAVHVHPVGDDGLVEPVWGRVESDSAYAQKAPTDSSGSTSASPLGDTAPAISTYRSVGPFLRAGLLLMATSRPGRALLSWHPNLRHSMQQQQHDMVNARLGVWTFEHSEHGEEATLTAAKSQQQTPHALQVRTTSEVFDSIYKLGKQAGRGSFGEVWLATKLTANSSDPTSGSNSTSRKTAGTTSVHTRNLREDASGQRQHTESAFGHDDAASQHVEPPSGRDSNVVLKRVSGSSGDGIKHSALREAYFGQLLLKHQAELQLQAQQESQHSYAASLLEGHRHLVRFVEGFSGNPDGDVWLVFQNAGKSLHSLMYEATQLTVDPKPHSPKSATRSQQDEHTSNSPPGISLVGPSRWWAEVRTSSKGHLFVASMMQQLLQGLEAVHAANISHRDVKPENLLVTPLPAGSGGAGSASLGGTEHSGNSQPDPLLLHLRLIDFGSAVDRPSIAAGLYGRRRAGGVVSEGAGEDFQGPSMDELTLEYAPPEVLFSSRYHHPLAAGLERLHAYDIWSSGVVMLELILGTPSVFTPSPATRAAVDKQLHLQGRPTEERQLLYLLRGLMELCIYPPRVTSTPINPQRATIQAGLDKTPLPIPWSCCDDALLKLISSRDPQGIGLEGPLGLRLLQRVLSWDPSRRPTAQQALQHAYFVAAEYMRRRNLTAGSEHYQRLVAECSRLRVGQTGWC